MGMDLAQHTATNSAHINMTSPLLDFQGNNIQITPSLNALTNGLFDLSNPTTPHLPPLNIDTANSQSLLGAMNVSPTMPPMPIVDVIGNNIPPPTDGLDWHTICTLNSLMGQQQQIETHSSNQNYRKRKKMTLSHTNPNQLLLDVDSKSNIESTSPSKRRKLNNHKTTKTENGNQHQSIISRIPKKRKRGRPRKNPEIVHSNGIKREKNVKKEKKEKRKRKKRTDDEYEDDDDDSNDDYHYLHSQYGADSYVGIRTEDGEVRIQIPRGKNKDTQCAKVKFSVFGNACSDKIEDILQPKKRTRYVRGLSEEEKKTRRREQNRNAAARSRARKNAMISKVIALHSENMGLRAFVAENITQTKVLRDEINRLNAVIILHQQQPTQQQSAPTQSTQNGQSSLFDIINQDSSTLFDRK